MCGRYTLTSNETKLAKRFLVENVHKLIPQYNIYPTQPIVGIRMNEYTEENEVAIMNWGLVPFWAKDPKIGAKMTNARSETAADKPAFRGPMRHHRCLIPANGFYEWKRSGSHKSPHYFHRSDHELFAFAGLWEHWASPDGSEIESCTILTTGANEMMRPIHHRMPVIIEEKDFERWLDPSLQQPRKVSDLLKAPQDDFFVSHPVSKLVNTPQNNGPELVEPQAKNVESNQQIDFFSDFEQ